VGLVSPHIAESQENEPEKGIIKFKV